MNVYLVWTSNNGIPYPQKWYDDKFTSETKKEHAHIKKIKITEEEAKLTIYELSMKYPLEEKPNVA